MKCTIFCKPISSLFSPSGLLGSFSALGAFCFGIFLLGGNVSSEIRPWIVVFYAIQLAVTTARYFSFISLPCDACITWEEIN